VFIHGHLQQAFTARFDAGEWWTGVRASEDRPEIRDDTPKETLRSCALVGNSADTMVDAVRSADFGPAGATLHAPEGVACQGIV
jgi:hypothetical protein